MLNDWIQWKNNVSLSFGFPLVNKKENDDDIVSLFFFDITGFFSTNENEVYKDDDVVRIARTFQTKRWRRRKKIQAKPK